MTNQHPIIPPPELWKQLAAGAYTWKEAVAYAYRAGADQELEACCEWLLEHGYDLTTQELHYARRPKPLSLKEQALLAIDAAVADGRLSPDVSNVVRRALEQLDD